MDRRKKGTRNRERERDGGGIERSENLFVMPQTEGDDNQVKVLIYVCIICRCRSLTMTGGLAGW